MKNSYKRLLTGYFKLKTFISLLTLCPLLSTVLLISSSFYFILFNIFVSCFVSPKMLYFLLKTYYCMWGYLMINVGI